MKLAEKANADFGKLAAYNGKVNDFV